MGYSQVSTQQFIRIFGTSHAKASPSQDARQRTSAATTDSNEPGGNPDGLVGYLATKIFMKFHGFATYSTCRFRFLFHMYCRIGILVPDSLTSWFSSGVVLGNRKSRWSFKMATPEVVLHTWVKLSYNKHHTATSFAYIEPNKLVG